MRVAGTRSHGTGPGPIQARHGHDGRREGELQGTDSDCNNVTANGLEGNSFMILRCSRENLETMEMRPHAACPHVRQLQLSQCLAADVPDQVP